MNYEIFGWFVTRANIGFLIPLTLINGTALLALLLAVIFARQNGYPDPFEPRDVHYDTNSSGKAPAEWKEEVPSAF